MVLLAGGVLACAGWLQWATRLSFALALPGASWPAFSDSGYSAWDLRSPLATKAKGSVRATVTRLLHSETVGLAPSGVHT